MANIIMSWSECLIELGKTGENDALTTKFASIGETKDKSTSLTIGDGEKLTAKGSGGKIVAQEEKDGEITLKTRILEPDFAFISGLLNANLDKTSGNLQYKSLIVPDNYSIKVTPKNIGAKGILVRKAHVNYKEGHSEDEGFYADMTFTVLKCSDGELYSRFVKKA